MYYFSLIDLLIENCKYEKINIKNRCKLFDFLLTQIISFQFILVLF